MAKDDVNGAVGQPTKGGGIMKGIGKFGVVMALVLVGAVGLIAYSCGPQPVDLSIKQDNSSPNGSVQGVIREVNTGIPIQNASIKTQVGGGSSSTSSDSNGFYSLGGLGGGNTYNVYYGATNHATSIINVGPIPNAVGLYPQGNGILIQDVNLFPNDGSIIVYITATTGAACGTCPTGTSATSFMTDASSVVNLISSGFDYAQSQTGTGATSATYSNLPASSGGVDVCVQLLSRNCGTRRLVHTGLLNCATVYDGTQPPITATYNSCI